MGKHNFLWFSGLYTLTRNTSRFESRVGSPARTQHIFSAKHQHRNDELGRHSVKESQVISDVHRRPEFYIPSSQKQIGQRPSSSHPLQVKRPNISHQSADRNTFYRQPGFDERKQEAALHQIAPRIYPFKLGPDKVKPTLDMNSHTYEMSGGKPPQAISSNIHEISKVKQYPKEMPHPDKMTHDYIDTDPYHDTGVDKPHDYHYDHSYDSDEYLHHPPPHPPPKTEPVVGHYRVGFKLFYIPLYAGIVFVAFVLILMIRSITRHKGQVTYDLLTNPPARMLSDDVAERVIRALETSRQRYNRRHK
jgi:hypothetical protein